MDGGSADFAGAKICHAGGGLRRWCSQSMSLRVNGTAMIIWLIVFLAFSTLPASIQVG